MTTPPDRPRLIETAFPLRQTSIDSVHEKNVRHGHISTLHIWPARRPLAACRAALIATLLPDPGDAEERAELLRRLAGRVVQKRRRKKMPNGKIEDVLVEETEGGILHWGRENGPDLQWFRDKIRAAYGGRAPRVLDPFAGGGAIPLEAMRLGCEATAIDLNPVAWFILKCTLEYPQRLAGQRRPLPAFIRGDRAFMRGYFESARGLKGKALESRLATLFGDHEAEPSLIEVGSGTGVRDGSRSDNAEGGNGGLAGDDDDLSADLAWHVRAWGQWVLREARVSLARFYPTYAEWEALRKGPRTHDQGPRPDGEALRLCPLAADGSVDAAALNAEVPAKDLAEPGRPRWVPKPTVAYLWARTVACKQCRARVPLLKTRWLCKKDDKRVLLLMAPDAARTGVEFGVERDVPKLAAGNPAQRREHDRRLGAGTMSRSGAQCPCCATILTMEDIRLEGQAGRLGATMTAVVVDGRDGKEYRRPTELEVRRAEEAEQEIEKVFADVPFGVPTEPTPKAGTGASRAFSVDGYGLGSWNKLLLPRQLLTIGTLVKSTRRAFTESAQISDDILWREAIASYLALAIDRVANRASTLCIWNMKTSLVEQTFARFALPILWDFAESNPTENASGSYAGETEWIAAAIEHTMLCSSTSPSPKIESQSAKVISEIGLDLIVTDPPYYDAIPYSDLMDFFYIWLRRTLKGINNQLDSTFEQPLAPKWNHERNDGELIDDSSRFGGDATKSKMNYESGMATAFRACWEALNPEGRLVIVFAHKQPDAWETLVSAMIKAGFVVDGSWPIQTERAGRMRANASAALSSSVWLVCKKRSPTARPGWDNIVLEQMRTKIATQLRAFWDAGIRGPDFVWAATGPAMEAYSQHPAVKKANNPGELLGVGEFLRHVRRMVVNYVVGRLLPPVGTENDRPGDGDAPAADATTPAGREELDDVTTYYLLHRHNFALGDAPAGASILYAVSCNLSDRLLLDTYDLLARSGGQSGAGDDDADGADDAGDSAEGDDEAAGGTGSTVRLRAWNTRRRPGLGLDPATDSPAARREADSPTLFAADEATPASAANAGANARPRVRVPLIDQAHRLMQLWKAGDVRKVDEYLELRALRRHGLFHQLLQALIELSPAGSEERATLESISNHLQIRVVRAAPTGGGHHQEELLPVADVAVIATAVADE